MGFLDNTLITRFERSSNPPKAEPFIEGSHHVETEKFRNHIGRSAFKVYVKLIRYREFEGTLQYFVTNSYIAAQTGLKVETVRKILRKLKRVGLIKELGDVQVWIPSRDGSQRGICNKKIVFGTWRNGQVYLPDHLVQRVLSTNTHGGKRVNSGRKRSIKMAKNTKNDTQKEDKSFFQVSHPPKSSKIEKTLEEQGVKSEIKFPTQKSSFPGYKKDKDYISYRYITDSKTVSSLKEKNPLEGSSPKALKEVMPQKQEPVSQEEIIEFIREHKPPMPTAEYFRYPVLPKAKKLDPKLSDEEKVEFLIHAYNQTVTAIYDKKSFILMRSIRNGTLTSSKYYKRLLAAADFLAEKGIRPHTWASWYIDFFYIDHQCERTGADPRKPPSINLVFNKTFIADHRKRNWFYNNSTKYDGGRLMMPDLALDVWAAYRSFISELTNALPLNDVSEVSSLMETLDRKHFGERGWKKVYRMIQSESDKLYDRLQSAVRNQSNLWVRKRSFN